MPNTWNRIVASSATVAVGFGALIGALNSADIATAVAATAAATDAAAVETPAATPLETAEAAPTATAEAAPAAVETPDAAPAASAEAAPTAEATVAAEAATGALNVTYFEDESVNNTYDDGDTLRDTYIYVQDAAGQWWSTTANADGTYTIEGLAEGQATVYFTMPNSPGRQVVFNAEDTSRFEQGTMEAANDVNYYDSTTGEIIPARIGGGSSVAYTTVNITADAPAALEAGLSMVSARAIVTETGSTEGRDDLASVKLRDGNRTLNTVWSEDSGQYRATVSADDAGEYWYLRDNMVAEIVPAAGYELVDVKAFDGNTELTVTQSRGTYAINRADLSNEFAQVQWKAEVQPLGATGSMSLQYFRDLQVDNQYNEGADELRDAYIYVQDAKGQWWSTTANADGTYNLGDLPVGEATVYLTSPVNVDDVVIFDAETLERLPQQTTEAQDSAIYVDPDTGERTAARIPGGVAAAKTTVTITEDGDVARSIGMSRVSSTAKVVEQGSEEGRDDLAQINFGDTEGTPATAWSDSNSEFRAVVSDDDLGQHWFLGDELSIEVFAEAGYEIASVKAFDDSMELTVNQISESGSDSGVFAVDRSAVADSNSRVEWLVEIVPVEVTETPTPTTTATPTPTETETPAPTAEPTETEEVAEPALEVTPGTATVEESTQGFVVVGTDWPANTEITLTVKGPNGYETQLTATTNGDGAFEEKLTWATFDADGNLIADNQPFPAGDYTVVATDGETELSGTFTVTGADAPVETSAPGKGDGGNNAGGNTGGSSGGVNGVDTLPKTGADSTVLVAGLVAALTLAGGGMTLVARRRAQ